MIRITRRSKRYLLLAAAFAFVAAGMVGIYLGVNNLALRTAGMLACVISTFLVRASVAAGKGEVPQSSMETVRQRPGSRMWAIALVLVATVPTTYWLLYRDALNGGKEVAPLYLFVAAVLVAASYLGYLFAKYF